MVIVYIRFGIQIGMDGQDEFLEAWPKICGLFVEIDKKAMGPSRKPQAVL